MNRAERRRKRLLMLLDAYDGTDAEFARAMNTDPAYLSQIKTQKRKSFGDRLAASAETAAGMPDGWLDQWLPDEGGKPNPEDTDPFLQRIAACSDDLPPSAKAAILELLYAMIALSTGKPKTTPDKGKRDKAA